MTQEHKEFVVEASSFKGPMYMIPHHKINLLENKILFYEGQVDPLYDQTIFLKENIMSLSRLVAVSNQILRNLLPTHNDPAKKLKIQMSNIEEISIMIHQDWKDMEYLIQRLKKKFLQQQNEKRQWMQKYYSENISRNREREQFQATLLESNMKSCQKEENMKLANEKLTQTFNVQKNKLSQQIEMLQKMLKSTLKQFELHRHQSRLKDQDHQKHINRLNRHIENSMNEFEESKKVVKQLCQNLMNEKLLEQAENYEYMVKTKQKQNLALSIKIDDTNEEMIRIKQEKDKQIQKNYNKINNLFKTIAEMTESISVRDQSLKQQSNKRAKLQTHIQQITKQMALSQQKIQKLNQINKQITINYEQKVKNYEQSIKILKQTGQKAVLQLIQKCQIMLNQINIYQNDINNYKIIIQQTQQKMKQKIQQINLQWKQKQNKYNQILSQKQVRINLADRNYLKLKQQKQRQLRYLKQQYFQSSNQKQKKHNRILIEMKNEINMKIKEAEYQKQKEMERTVSFYKEKIQNQKLKTLEISQQLQKKKKIQLEEEKIKVKNQLLKKQAQLHQVVHQKKQLIQNLKKYQAKIQQNQRYYEQQKLNLLKKINRLEQLGVQERQKLNDQLQAQTNIFQTEFFARQQAMTDMKDKYESQLLKRQQDFKNIKAQLLDQIILLKQVNAVELMQKKYNEQMKEMRRQHYERLNELKDNHRNELNDLINLHKNQTNNMMKCYQDQINTDLLIHQKNLVQIIIAAQIKGFQTADRQIFGFNTQNLQISEEHLKKTYALYCIHKIHNIIVQKQNIITDLNQKIINIQSNFDQILTQKRKKIDQQLQNKQKQYEDLIQKMRIQCYNKINISQNQRTAFSQKMYQQFKQLQQNHKKLYDKLMKKYNELELCFEERPSRQQDVAKIKQLSDIREVLDTQISKYHKKMQTANEIVKYLNLQLQNYKETYDIFRPNAEITNFTSLITNSVNHNSNLYKISNVGANVTNGLHIPIKQNGKSLLLQNPSKEEVKKTIKLNNLFKKNSQNTQLKIVKDQNEAQDVEDGTVILKSKRIDARQRKFSHNIQKPLINKQKIKTQKVNNKQEAQIFSYAESFMNIIQQEKGGNNLKEKQKASHQEDYKQMNRYRKRKLKTLNNTSGVEHY